MTESIIRKSGRPTGTINPLAACHNKELARANKKTSNDKFKLSTGYLKMKIKMNCKNNQLDIPNLDNKTLEELREISFDIKLQGLQKRNI